MVVERCIIIARLRSLEARQSGLDKGLLSSLLCSRCTDPTTEALEKAGVKIDGDKTALDTLSSLLDKGDPN